MPEMEECENIRCLIAATTMMVGVTEQKGGDEIILPTMETTSVSHDRVRQMVLTVTNVGLDNVTTSNLA